MAAAVSPYPWEALERLTRSSLREATRARRALGTAVDLSALQPAASAVLGAEVTLIPREMRAADGAFRQPVVIPLAVDDGSAYLTFALDPTLAAEIAARVLGRKAPVAHPRDGVGPSVAGAVAAALVEIARRAHEGRFLQLLPSVHAHDGLELSFTALLDGRAFDLTARVTTLERPTRAAPADLRRLETVPVPLALVVGRCLAEAAELATLTPGDAWLCGEGWWLDEAGVGRAALAAPGCEWGLAAEVGSAGEIVIRGHRVDLSADVESDMTQQEDVREHMEGAVLVVRIELGSVTLNGKEWAELAPGDVIETGRRIAEPVVLRVGGREVATGELVNVEGELGVRIARLTKGEAG